MGSSPGLSCRTSASGVILVWQVGTVSSYVLDLSWVCVAKAASAARNHCSWYLSGFLDLLSKGLLRRLNTLRIEQGCFTPWPLKHVYRAPSVCGVWTRFGIMGAIPNNVFIDVHVHEYAKPGCLQCEKRLHKPRISKRMIMMMPAASSRVQT